jgi:hypothetical protein
MNTKTYWIVLGWTPADCLSRLETARKNAQQFRTFPNHSRYSYRVINANLYRQAKSVLALLRSP